MIRQLLPWVLLALVERTVSHEETTKRLYTRDELLNGFVRKLDVNLDALSRVYQNKSNSESLTVQAICKCGSTVFNYGFDKRVSQCEHLARDLFEGPAFSRNYVYMADQMKTSVVGLNLETHGVIIYACVRSTPEFLDMSKESRKALAKELLELKATPGAVWDKIRIMNDNKQFGELSIEKQRAIARTFLNSPTENSAKLINEMNFLIHKQDVVTVQPLV